MAKCGPNQVFNTRTGTCINRQPVPPTNFQCPSGEIPITIPPFPYFCYNPSKPAVPTPPNKPAPNVQSVVGSSPPPGPSATCGTCSITDLGACICIFGAMLHDTLVSWGEHVAIFVIAVIVIIIGFFLLNQQGVTSLVKKALPV